MLLLALLLYGICLAEKIMSVTPMPARKAHWLSGITAVQVPECFGFCVRMCDVERVFETSFRKAMRSAINQWESALSGDRNRRQLFPRCNRNGIA